MNASLTMDGMGRRNPHPPSDWRSRIDVDARVCHGQACITGTRIPVTVILDNLADGRTASEILADYPTLCDADVRAALTYAAELAHDHIIALPSE